MYKQSSALSTASEAPLSSDDMRSRKIYAEPPGLRDKREQSRKRVDNSWEVCETDGPGSRDEAREGRPDGLLACEVEVGDDHRPAAPAAGRGRAVQGEGVKDHELRMYGPPMVTRDSMHDSDARKGMPRRDA